MHLAAREDSLNVLRHILASGQGRMMANIPNAELSTPLHYGASADRVEALRVLLGAGADPNPRDNAGNTPLHVALFENRLQAFECLLEARGVSIDLQNKDGLSIREVALHEPQFERVLRKHRHWHP